MILKRIEIKGFKKLIGPVTIDTRPGLCIIGGGNEEGKSTLFEALRALFFQRHSSTGQQIKDMLPYGADVKPEIAASFELAGKNYKLRKSFSSKTNKGSARLEGEGLLLEGSSVEEKLQELFMWGAAAGKKTTDSDTGIWGMLWLLQTASIDGLKLGPKCRETVSGAIESELGKMIGGKAGDELLKSIKPKYDLYWTATGKSSKKEGSLHALEEGVAELNAKLATADAELKSYATKMETLSRKEEARAKHRTERSLENAEKELEEAVKQKDLLAQLENEVGIWEERVKHGESAQRNLKARHDRRVELKETISRFAQQSFEKNEMLEKERLAQAELTRGLEDIQKNVDICRANLEKARADLTIAEKAQEYVKLKAELARDNQALDRAVVIEAEIQSTLKERDAISVLPQDVVALRTLERDHAQAKSRLEAASTKIRLRPQSGRKASFDGKELIESELTLSAAGTIKLDDWGEIEVLPGGEDLSKRQALAADLHKKLAALLAKLKVETADEAAELSDKRKSLSLELDAATMQLNGLAPQGMAALRTKIGSLNAGVQAFGEIDERLTDPSAVSSMRTEITRLDKEERAQRDTLDRVRNQIAEFSSKSIRLEADLKSLDQQINAAEQSLKKELEDCPDEELSKELEKATDQLMVDQKQRDLVKTSLATKKPQAISDQFHQARAKKERIAKECAELDKEIYGLNAELEVLGQRGLEEEKERLVQHLEKAQKEVAALQLTANAYKLLWDTLFKAKSEAREEFILPLSKRLEPYLASVLPDANLNIDRNELSIVGLQRNGLDESFGDLSIGTREQLAVLTRLAMAELLHSRGMPALVILDDALVYSDEQRFAAMKKALLRGATQYQILILTCRPSDYDDMGVPIIQLADCKRTELAGLTESSLS